MTKREDLQTLLNQTSELRRRFEQHSPNSGRLGILIRDEQGLRFMLGQAA